MWIPFRGLPLQSFLSIPNFDLPRFGFCALSQSDLQNALVIAGFYFFRVHGVRELESAYERTVAALNAMEILFLLFFFKLALALDGQSVVFHADVYVLIVQAGNFQLQDQVLLVLVNVDRGNKAACGQLVLSRWFGKAFEKARQFAEGVNSSD